MLPFFLCKTCLLFHLAAAVLNIFLMGSVTTNICLNSFVFFLFIRFTPNMTLSTVLLVLFNIATSLSLKYLALFPSCCRAYTILKHSLFSSLTKTFLHKKLLYIFKILSIRFLFLPLPSF